MSDSKDWIEMYLDYTDNTEPPELYKEWCGISTLAAVLKRRNWLNWGLKQKIYPNMYVVLVGPAGRCRKSTAMAPAKGLLTELGVKLAASSITREALIQDLDASSESTQTEDGSIITHASMTIMSSELTVFLGHDNPQLLMDLTNWYDCEDNWEYRTKQSGDNFISGVWVNLLGATTPHLIQRSLPMDAVGGGLASRIVFVYEDRKSKKVPAPFVTDRERELEKELIKGLQNIAEQSGPYRLTQGAGEWWHNWYTNMEKTNPNMPPTFEGYINRRQVHLLKLAMILSSSRATDSTILVQDFERALELLERTEIKMPRTYAGMGSSRYSQVITVLHEYISKNRIVSFRDAFSDLYGYMEGHRQFLELVKILESQGFCKKVLKGDKIYLVYQTDHKLHGQYGEENVHSSSGDQAQRQHTNGKHDQDLSGEGGPESVDGGGSDGSEEGGS